MDHSSDKEFYNSLEENDLSKEGMQTRVWGPAGWLFLHSIAQNYPWNPDDQKDDPKEQDKKKKYLQFFELVGDVLPCLYCRNSYREFIKQPDTILNESVMENRKSLSLWLYKLHNKVNKKLEKEKEHECKDLHINSNPTFKDTWKRYETYRADCKPKQVKKQTGCTDALIGKPRLKAIIQIQEINKCNGNFIGSPTRVSFGKKKKKRISVKQSEDECSICLEPMTSGGKIVSHSICKNKFHKKCITQWRRSNRSCPLCISKRGSFKFGETKKIKLISIKKSTKAGKKLMATFETNGRKKVIHFGQQNASDYTKHKDIVRRNRYIFRHHKDLKGDPTRAGYLSMFILWNKPSLQSSIADYRKRLNSAKFSTKITGYSSPGKKKQFQ